MDLRFFEATPGLSIIILTDAPFYTIIAASNDLVKQSGISREQISNQHFFGEGFQAWKFLGDFRLREHFDVAVTEKRQHEISLLQYEEPGSAYLLSSWKINIVPLLNEQGETSHLVMSATDITEQETRRQLIDSSDGLKKAYNFFMNAPVIIGLVMGEDNIIELANEGLLEVWARGPEVVGKPLLQALPEIAAQGFGDLLEEVRRTGEPFYANEFPITLTRHGKDEVLFFDFVYKPFYDNEKHDKAAGVISVGYEVTRQVMAKKSVEESQARYRTLFESMDQGFCIFEVLFNENDEPVDYIFLEINPAFEKQSGLKNAEGKRILELSPDMEKSWFELYGKLALGGEPVKIKDESKALGRWFDIYAFKTGSKEERKVAAFFTDITDQVKAEKDIREGEQRFRNLADESPMFVFIIEPDPMPTFSYWNKTWLTYAGLTMEEAKGRAWDKIVHPDDIPGVMEVYVPAFEKQEGYFLPSVRLKKFDNTYRWHAFKANPRYDSDGGFIGFVGVGFDIHDQKLAEEKLIQNESLLQQKVEERTEDLERIVEELQRSNANLEEFAYAASHDMKEPIRKIMFFGERIKDSMSDRMEPEEARYFERLEAAAKRMGSLIDDLLSYSQVSIRPRDLEEIDMNQLVNQVLEDLDFEIEDTGALIKVDKLFSFRGHYRQLQQAFQNLISNAIKYNKPGVAPQVHIQCRKQYGKQSGQYLPHDEQEKLFYCISIRDNGIGFETADAHRIFNVFTRLHGNSEYRGTGIGLSIVRKVVENHEGYIWAESEPGQGSVFHVMLPGRQDF
jgi:PAS domain S-box-containing protein